MTKILKIFHVIVQKNIQTSLSNASQLLARVGISLSALEADDRFCLSCLHRSGHSVAGKMQDYHLRWVKTVGHLCIIGTLNPSSLTHSCLGQVETRHIVFLRL